MRFLKRSGAWVPLLAVLTTALGFSQAPPSPGYSSSKPAQPSPQNPGASSPKKQAVEPYCDHELGFCLTLPAGWKLVDVPYEGQGVTFAPEQKSDESLWAQFTVATTDIPAKEGQDPVTLDNLITALAGRMASQTQTMQTVRRSETSVAERPAEMIEVHYEQAGHQWAEIVTVVDAGEGEFYSLAFKSLAGERDQYTAALEEMLRTFRVLE